VTRPFRWLPHGGARHAVPIDLLPGDAGRTLCDADVVVPRQGCGKREWCWPTCPGCDSAWRVREGIPARTRP
jgi:hypothetical protein